MCSALCPVLVFVCVCTHKKGVLRFLNRRSVTGLGGRTQKRGPAVFEPARSVVVQMSACFDM
jgi:hypothetical protein